MTGEDEDRFGLKKIEGTVFPYSVPEPPPPTGMTLSEYWATALNAELQRGPPSNENAIRHWLSWMNRER